MQCLLLDMYPRGPLAECSYTPGDELLAAAPYFGVLSEHTFAERAPTLDRLFRSL